MQSSRPSKTLRAGLSSVRSGAPAHEADEMPVYPRLCESAFSR